MVLSRVLYAKILSKSVSQFNYTFSHRAWKVPQDVVEKPVFRLNGFDKAPRKSTLIWSTPVGISLPPTLFGISALFFPVTRFPKYWMGVLVAFLVMIFTAVIVIGLLFKPLQKNFNQQYHKSISDYDDLDDTINQIKSTNPEVLIEINKSNAYKIILLILKVVVALPILSLSGLLVLMSFDEPVNKVVVDGLLAGGMLIIGIFVLFLPCLGFNGAKGALGDSFETDVKSINVVAKDNGELINEK